MLKKSKAVPILLLCLSCFGAGEAWTILSAISNMLTEQKNPILTQGQYGDLALILILGAIFTSYSAGALGRRIGMKNVFLASLLLIALSMGSLFFPQMISYTEDQYPFFAASQLLLGMGIGALLTSLSAFLTLLVFDRIAIALTGSYACINLGSSLSPLLLQLTLNDGNWWVNAVALAFFFILLTLAAAYFLPNLKNKSTENQKKLLQVLSDFPAIFWIFPLTTFLYAIIEMSYSVWGPIFLHLHKGLSIPDSNFALSAFWGIVGVSQLTICALVTKISPKWIYRSLPVFFMISLFGILLSPSKIFSWFLFVLGGIGCSAFISLSVNFAEKKYHRVAELVSGILFFGYFIGSGLSSASIGWSKALFNIPLSQVFFLPAGLAILLLFLTFLLTLGQNHHKHH